MGSVCMFSRLASPGIGLLLQRNIFLALLRRARPGAHVTWVVGGPVTRYPMQDELVRSHSHADETLICPSPSEAGAWAAFMEELAARAFEVCVVDPSSDGLGVAEAAAAGIPVRVAVPMGRPGDELITHPVLPSLPPSGFPDLYDYTLALGRALGMSEVPPPGEVLAPMPYRPEELPEWAAAARPLVGVHPGGSKVWNRRWPLSCYESLCARLVREAGATLVLLGSGDEDDELSRLRSSVLAEVPSARVELSVEEPLNRVANLVAAMDLLVGNDSGPAHLAAAVRTPSVVVYGPTDLDFMWARVYPLHRAVNRHSPCAYGRSAPPPDRVGQCDLGCACFFVSPDAPYPRCLTGIPVDEVWDAVQAQLAASPVLRVWG